MVPKQTPIVPSRSSPRGGAGSQEPRVPVTGQEMECMLIQDQVYEKIIISPRFLLVSSSYCGKGHIGKRHRTGVALPHEAGLWLPDVMGLAGFTPFHLSAACSFFPLVLSAPNCLFPENIGSPLGFCSGGLNGIQCFVHYPVLMKHAI